MFIIIFVLYFQVKGLNSGLATSSKEVNLYHIALMLENYLLLEPNVSSEYIIKVNLLENLIMNCHNPKLSEILINLIDPYISRYNIFGESQVKLWEWCYENNFFFRVISLAQNEKFDKMLEEESETTEEILQNSKKYYSGEKTQMIMKEMVKKFGMFQGLIESKVTENQEVNLPIRNKTLDDEILENLLGKSTMKKNEFESIKVEEIQGNLPDIDNFKDFIESKNKRKFLGANTKTLNHTKDKEILSNSITILSFDTLNNSVISRSSNKNININSKKNNNSVLQNQNNISEDNSSNRSTLDMQMGFTVSKVKNIYPNRLCKELITALDKIVQKDEYKLQNLIEEEKIAMPATCLVFEILNSMIENEENDKTREFLNKRKCVGGASIVDMLFNNSSICLEKIFLVCFIFIYIFFLDIY